MEYNNYNTNNKYLSEGPRKVEIKEISKADAVNSPITLNCHLSNNLTLGELKRVNCIF